MKVNFKISTGNQDVDEQIKKRLLSLKITDKKGMCSDTAEIALDDRDSQLIIPSKVMLEMDKCSLTKKPETIKFDISIGYNEKLQEIGVFYLSEIELGEPPKTLKIKATAVNLTSPISALRNESYYCKTIGQIVDEIASRNGVSYNIPVDIAGIEIAHIDQTYESDIHFLTRISANYNLFFKVTGSHLVLQKNLTGETPKSKKITPVIIERNQISTWTYKSGKRSEYDKVVATWHNKCTNEVKTEFAGDQNGKKIHKIKHPYSNQNEAKNAAESIMKSLKRSEEILSFAIPGNPEILSETPVIIKGLRKEIDGKWIVTEAIHTIDNSGFKSQIEARIPFFEPSNEK